MIALMRSLSGAFFDPYRPELHYMRGPGPKWREKHGIAASRARLVVTPPQRPYPGRFTTNERDFSFRNANLMARFRRLPILSLVCLTRGRSYEDGRLKVRNRPLDAMLLASQRQRKLAAQMVTTCR